MEMKIDGERMLCHKEGDNVSIPLLYRQAGESRAFYIYILQRRWIGIRGARQIIPNATALF